MIGWKRLWPVDVLENEPVDSVELRKLLLDEAKEKLSQHPEPDYIEKKDKDIKFEVK